MTKDKYQWSEDAVNAITTISSELSEHYNFTVTFEQAVEAAAKHYLRSVLAIGERAYQRNEKLRKRVTHLDISELAVRIHNSLQTLSIEYIWQLVEMNEADLLNTCFGRKQVYIVQKALADFGLKLGMELHPIDKALALIAKEEENKEGLA